MKMSLTLQLLASAVIVLGVLVFMWRLPRHNENLFPWGAPLAFISVWSGLIGLLLTALLWVLSYPDRWLVLILLVLDPLALTSATLVFWLYRGYSKVLHAVAMQKLQARVGLTLGSLAVALGYLYVMTHKTPFTEVGH